MNIFNLKLSFRNGKPIKIERGDFGPANRDKPSPKRTTPPTEDCFISWPVEPNFTGPGAILIMLGLEPNDVKHVGFNLI